MHSTPLIYRRNAWTPWYCGVCYAPLEDYGVKKMYKYCSTCGSEIDSPFEEGAEWKHISEDQRWQGYYFQQDQLRKAGYRR